jgi:hypothetical protein
MPAGLYADIEIVERFLSSYAAGNITQKFVCPCDMEVQGLLALIGTAPGGSASVAFNVSVSPTSQLASVSAYNLWTTANAPAVVGNATTTFTTSTSQSLIKNVPYALNYPLPGAPGSTGYTTAQATSQTTDSPVTSPPTMANYQMGPLTPPDNTYTDFNGITGTPASYVHAGDVLTFSLAAGTGGAGSAGGTVEVALYMLKR